MAFKERNNDLKIQYRWFSFKWFKTWLFYSLTFYSILYHCKIVFKTKVITIFYFLLLYISINSFKQTNKRIYIKLHKRCLITWHKIQICKFSTKAREIQKKSIPRIIFREIEEEYRQFSQLYISAHILMNKKISQQTISVIKRSIFNRSKFCNLYSNFLDNPSINRINRIRFFFLDAIYLLLLICKFEWQSDLSKLMLLNE